MLSSRWSQHEKICGRNFALTSRTVIQPYPFLQPNPLGCPPRPVSDTSYLHHQTSSVLQPDVVQRECDGVQRLFTFRRLQLTLPYRDAMPAHCSQLTLFLFISFLVPANLRHPKLPIRLWNFAALRVRNCKL